MEQPRIQPWLIIRTYLRIVAEYKWAVFACYALFAVVSVVDMGVLKVQYKRLVDLLEGGNTSQAFSAAVGILGIIVLCKIFIHGLAGLSDFWLTKLRTKELKTLNDYVFTELPNHSYVFFSNNFTGSLVAKARRFTSAYQRMADRFLFNGISTGVDILTSMALLLYLSPQIGLFFAGWIVVYVVIVYSFARYKLPYDGQVATNDSKVTAYLADMVTNVLTVKVFGNSSYEKTRFNQVTTAEQQARLQAWRLENYFRVVQAASIAFLEVAAIYIALRLWNKGQITVGTIVLVQTYFIAITGKLWELRRAINDIFISFSDASEMVEILTTEPAVKDPVHPKKLTVTKGKLELQNVSFAYNGNTELFTNLNLTVQPGEHVGIVGHSGSGKSTIFKLLLRFLDVQSGSILLDGQPITASLQDDVRSSYGFVSQEPYMFHRSLHHNIAYGKPDATAAEVQKAAKKAHADAFIQALPLKYQTLVGERGVKLSGGERQRVALARIILQDAKILLFDEATSALDSSSEKYIQENMQQIMQGKTALVIAHRISTIKQLDRIIVLDQGAIIEEGTHSSLLKQKGKYAELWKHQSDGFIVDE